MSSRSSLLVVYTAAFHATTASLFLKRISALFRAEHFGAFQPDGHQLQWLSTHAHSGLMSTGSLETAWCEQRGGIFMPLSKGLESLEMRWVVLSSHNGNNYQTEEAHFWNKVCLAVQLTLGCSHQIPSVSTAERLSEPLGPMPVQYLMLLPLPEPAHSPILRRISMQARWNARYAESAVSEWRLNYPGALIGGSLQPGYPRFPDSSLPHSLFPVCLCTSVRAPVNKPDGQQWVQSGRGTLMSRAKI